MIEEVEGLTVSARALPFGEQILVRFGATLVGNVVRAAVSFITGLLVARGLGAEAYGDLSFLLGSFAALSHLFDLGTSAAFYTFVSQRRRAASFFVAYFGWLALQFVVTVACVGLIFPDRLVGWIFVGHQRSLVLTAFGASFLTTQVWNTVTQLGEARRKTVLVQAAGLGQAVVHLALITTLLALDWLDVRAVVWTLIAEHAVLVALLGRRLLRQNLAAGEPGAGGVPVADLWDYCRPLIVYNCMGFLYAFADRWLLQTFGGAREQGFFAVGQQFANVALIAAASMGRVFWKEIAEARERQDHRQVEQLFRTVSRSLYFSAAWLSCLLIPYTREVLGWTVGAGFDMAWLPMMLLLLYPIHQSLGQVHGTFFYASGDTRSLTRLGLLTMGISIPVTYLVLAPASSPVPGLGLGALGVALKMVAIQIVGVVLQSFVIARANSWRWRVGYQAGVLIALLALGWGGRVVAGLVLGRAAADIAPPGMVVVGVIFYVVLSAFFVGCLPETTGLTREKMRSLLRAVAASEALKTV